MFIQRLLYKSQSALNGGEDAERQVSEILAVAAARNKAADVTGVLLFAGEVFIQLLEGPVEAVEKRFERICCDLRHRRVRLLQLAVSQDRLCEGLPMARIAMPMDSPEVRSVLRSAGGDRLDAAAADTCLKLMQSMAQAQSSIARAAMIAGGQVNQAAL